MKQVTILVALFTIITGIEKYSHSGAQTGTNEGVTFELLDCDGNPWIFVEGTEHWMVHIQDNGNRFNFRFHVQANYAGYDLEGNEYILNYQGYIQFNFGDNGQNVDHIVASENLVRKGSGGNFRVKIHFKIITNANGEITVQSSLFGDYCD